MIHPRVEERGRGRDGREAREGGGAGKGIEKEEEKEQEEGVEKGEEEDSGKYDIGLKLCRGKETCLW